MTGMPEAGRQAAHVFLDAVSGGSFTDRGVDSAVSDLAITRLNEVNAVRATLDETDELHIDISDLVGGVLVAMNYLIRQLSLYAEVDALEVIVRTREFLDGED